MTSLSLYASSMRSISVTSNEEPDGEPREASGSRFVMEDEDPIMANWQDIIRFNTTLR